MKRSFVWVAGVALLNTLLIPLLWSHENEHHDDTRKVRFQVQLTVEAAKDFALKKAWVGSYSLELLPCAPRVSWWQSLSPVTMAYANHGESFTTPLQWKLARFHDLNASHQETLVDASIPVGDYCSIMLTWGHPQLKPGDRHYSTEVGRYSFQLENAKGETRQAMNAFSQIIEIPEAVGGNDNVRLGLHLDMANVLSKVNWAKSSSHFMSDWFQVLGKEIEVSVR